ncbi:MAG TPA: inositol monophosphatase family protein [Thermodesulfobacteriota bacterium]|nr:inositol monophosphatase family protein [Thermodesulfobacteriota bacterium]
MDIKDKAIKIAREAGFLLKENLSGPRTIEFKGSVDIVTEMDRKAEELIVNSIRRDFPDHGILTEESIEVVSDSPYRWIIDPLDGTTNYAHGFPIFCVSVAFEEKDDVTFGVVYDPTRDELFTAEKNKGAFLNGQRIKVSSVPKLDKSLLATGFPYDVRTSSENNIDNFSRFAIKAQAIRRAGSAALDLSYAACGRFDGFWEMKLKPWDVAAAALMVREAGGTISGFKNEPFTIYSGNVLASNSLIHNEMLSVLNRKQ